ncbi:MAG TPA: ATP-binding protein [Acidimicrobiales bacterium]|nr:ATP-binding protein [Acidimicrobiales bacterium]
MVKALMRSHQQGDDRAFHSAAEALIEDERRKRHDLLANELTAILQEPTSGKRPLHVSSLKPLPKTRDDLPLLSISQPSVTFQDLVLPADVSSVLESVVDEFRQRSMLRAHGVRPRSTLLFVGPPGCGKSVSGAAIAGELGLAIARIQLATVVSSYLGETARNLEQIFTFLNSGSWVLQFDEFDMLGRERSDRSDHGELRRVVAAMLQIIDENNADSVFVATSNHPGLLDSAVWRRFDEVVEFPLPDEAARAALIRLKLRGVRADLKPTEEARRMEGLSAADIESVCLNAIRLMVRRFDKAVTAEHIAYGMEREEARRRAINSSLG